MDILGNDAAFKKLRGRGCVYTNCNKGDVNENHKYTIPFVSNDYIKSYLLRLIQKCTDEKHIYRHAEFYDEKKNHNISELKKWSNMSVIKSDKARQV